jgi:hypothetical protein
MLQKEADGLNHCNYMFVQSYNNITTSEEKFLKKSVAVQAGRVQTEV